MAEVYNDGGGAVPGASATADFVSRFGPGLDVLELGVGSGRLARAISAGGHTAIGIDISPEMLAHATATPVVRADMADLPTPDRSVDIVLVATNTLFNLTDVDDQQRCLAEAARVVRPTGRVVIEAFVAADADPSIDRLVTTRAIDAGRVVLTATIRDSEQQIITGQHIDITEAGIRLRPWQVRYSLPDELDAMAGQAGLDLVERYASWDRAEFGPASENHISVYAPTRR